MLQSRTLLIALSSLAVLAWVGLEAAFAQAPIIEGQPLQPLSAWEAGVVEPGSVPAPGFRWRDANPDQLADSLRGLPDVLASPAAWRLTLRTLTSPAAMGPADPDGGLAVARFAILGRLGAARELAAIAGASSEARAKPAIALYSAQAGLANGSNEDACLRAREPVEPGPDLLTFRAYCAALAKQVGPMDVAVDLARSAGAKDTFLFAALPVIAGVSKAQPTGRYDTSLQAAVSLAAGLKPGPTPLKSASSMALLVVARSDGANAAMRYEAVERSLMRGGLDGALAQTGLQAVLKATPPKAKAPWLAEALKSVSALEAAARTSKIGSLIAAEKEIGRRAALARLFRSDILAGPRGGESGEAIAPLVYAGLLLGDAQTAQAWRARLPATAAASERAHMDAALAAATGKNMMHAAAQRVSGARGDEPRAARDVALLSALGPLSAEFQQFGATSPLAERFNELKLAALVEAASRGAAGEAALRAAALIAPGAGRFDVRGLTSIIQVLRQSGFEEDARWVAVEAMLG